MPPEPHGVDRRDLYEVSTLIRQRALSPVELTDTALRRIDELNPVLNAYIAVLADDARAAAEVAERELASGRYRGCCKQ